jgi:hypothetical protein
VALASVTVRRATEEDAAAIALAHLDSIRSLGARFYPPDVVAAWSEGLTPSLYRDAMRGGEAFFIAIGQLEGQRLCWASRRIALTIRRMALLCTFAGM